MNQPDQTPADLRHAGVPRTSGQYLLQAAAILVFGSLFFVPLFMYGCRAEVDRWRAASAMLQFEAGEQESAIATMEEIVANAERDLVLARSLAGMLRDTGRADDAVKICDRWLEKSSGAQAKDRARMLQTKASCQQEAGDPAAALETIKERQLLQGGVSTAEAISWLNDVAYYRALAGVELADAEKDINGVINEMENNLSWQIDRPVVCHASTVLAAAMILRELDRSDEAREILNRWIRRLDNLSYERESLLVERIYRAANQLPFGPELEKQVTARRRELIDRTNGGLALLLTLRALIAQESGDADRMEIDRVRIASLGFESEWIAERLPTLPVCVAMLEQAQAYLDTRGYVRVKQNRFQLAFPDLNLAILASATYSDALESPIFNSIELSSAMGTNENREARLELAAHTLAILLAHRMEAYRATGRLEKADLDAESIRELGYDPEDRLY